MIKGIRSPRVVVASLALALLAAGSFIPAAVAGSAPAPGGTPPSPTPVPTPVPVCGPTADLCLTAQNAALPGQPPASASFVVKAGAVIQVALQGSVPSGPNPPAGLYWA